jgi:hypothetical protein
MRRLDAKPTAVTTGGVDLTPSCLREDGDDITDSRNRAVCQAQRRINSAPLSGGSGAELGTEFRS